MCVERRTIDLRRNDDFFARNIGMLDAVVSAARGLLDWVSGEFISNVRAAMLENIIWLEGEQFLQVVDSEGRVVHGRRSRRYAVRWYAPDYLPSERITLGPTGKLTHLSIIQPTGARPDIEEGGIGERYCVLRVRAPGMQPQYLLRSLSPVDFVLEYEASDVYTPDHSGDPIAWVKRFARGTSLPRVLAFELELPREHPMLERPRVYKIKKLSEVEAVHTDIHLPDLTDAWERLPDPSGDSRLLVKDDLTGLRCELRPSRTDTAYKIEWDWWGRLDDRKREVLHDR